MLATALVAEPAMATGSRSPRGPLELVDAI